MDFANRGNRPNAQVPQRNSSTDDQLERLFEPSAEATNDKKSKGGRNLGGLTKIASIFLLLAVSVLLIATLFGLVFGGDAGRDESSLIDTDKYQAVFLDNQEGHVYFGKLEVYNSRLYRLTDIFYVRVEQQNIQPADPNQAQQPNISLVKLGNELHGPEDAMFIARDKVLYWENLKEDGQVTSAIAEFVKNGRQVPQDNSQSQQQNESTTPTQQEDMTQTAPTGTEETPTDTPTTP